MKVVLFYLKLTIATLELRQNDVIPVSSCLNLSTSNKTFSVLPFHLQLWTANFFLVDSDGNVTFAKKLFTGLEECWCLVLKLEVFLLGRKKNLSRKYACSKLQIKNTWWMCCCPGSVHSYRYKHQSDLIVRCQIQHLNPLSANPTKWSNTLKQFVSKSRRIIWVYLTIL